MRDRGSDEGARPAISVATITDQTPLESHRNKWPVNAMPSTTNSSTTPLIQFISRGYLYVACRKTCAMWITASVTMAVAP